MTVAHIYNSTKKEHTLTLKWTDAETVEAHDLQDQRVFEALEAQLCGYIELAGRFESVLHALLRSLIQHGHLPEYRE